MPLDVVKARNETPGCTKVLHFNNAGASLLPLPVIDAVNGYFRLEIEAGGYEAADMAKKNLDQFYDSAAKLIGCTRQEIAYFESATRAWDMVFYSLSFKPGDRILTSKAEYASSYIAFLQVAKRTGVKVEAVPNDEHGQLSVSELEKMIDSRVKLIAVAHIPTQGGLVNPAAAIGKVAKAHGIFYLLDATQSVGQMPIDVEAIHCDALCTTGRKYLRGPRGTGFLYIRKSKIEQLEPAVLDLQSARWTSLDQYTMSKDATRFETWERNYANVLGLKAAIEYAYSWGLENIWEKIGKLSSELRAKLGSIPGVMVRDMGKQLCGIVTFTVEGITAEEVSLKLREKGIHTSVSLVEYARLDLEERHLTSLVRASVHYYNTEEEIDLFCKEVARLVAR